ncbi:CAP domain-containing protein [Streptomyces sp. NPDC050610]|uniref:CAP domain-containing protein n=1 Tax=Streptomyces sp. NPDC050610 TaxID=3157097 RepID=UPI0034400B4A
MGRHGRPTSPPAATAPPSAADPAAGRHREGRRGRARAKAPVRTGLLSASAAMAIGAVAVTSGLLPGGENFGFGGHDGPSGDVRADGSPDGGSLGSTNSESASPAGRGPTPASRGGERAHAPSLTPSTPPASPSASPSPARTGESAAKGTGAGADPRPDHGATDRAAAPPRASDAAPAPAAPEKSAGAPASAGRVAAARGQVLALVNQERAKAGCSPVTASRPLDSLAGAFSEDMAERGFFAHTDPDGKSPWDRAAKRGIKNLGGENIARGQADAKAVMDTWMHSPGHKANILNCDYKTLGVGVHYGPGGPWWTQDFGF